MTAVGVVLLLSGLGAEPVALSVSGPRLARGDELHYLGEVVEASERLGNRFRKHHSLEIRVFVLEATRESADCAVLTILRPLADPSVKTAVVAIGAAKTAEVAAPSVRLDLIRLDDRGRVKLLRPAAGPPPLPLDSAELLAPPPIALDAPPVAEFGFFSPFPAKSVTVKSTWDQVEQDRPPVVWAATAETVWNGGRCLEITALQQSTGYDQPQSVLSGWKRTETVIVSPADGYASTFRRSIQRREGRDIIGTLTVTYEQQPRNRAAGVKYGSARREIETAWSLGEELRELLAAGRKVPKAEYRASLEQIDRYLKENNLATSFRPAVEAVQRRAEAAVAGVAPPVPAVAKVVKASATAVGELLDDFVLPEVARSAERFRLSGVRGTPVLLAAYRPQALGSKATLNLLTALQEKYGERVRIVPLALFESPDTAAEERAKLGIKLPVYDAATLEAPLKIDSWPVFLIVDANGKLRWRFDAGLGGETGYLIAQELDEVLKKPNK